MFVVTHVDRKNKVVVIPMPTTDNWERDRKVVMQQWHNANLHCVALLLAGWTVNGVFKKKKEQGDG